MAMKIRSVGECLWEVEARPDARVPARFVASPDLLPQIREDEQSLRQLQNVATLPGIVGCCVGHARHAHGLRLSDRRRGRDRPGDRRDQPRWRGLRHQLRGAAPGVLVARGGCAPAPGRDRRRALQRDPLRPGARRRRQGGPARDARGPASRRPLGDRARLRHRTRSGTRRGAKLHRGRRPGRGERDGDGAREGSARNPGSGNHFLELGVVDEILEPEAAARVRALSGDS